PGCRSAERGSSTRASGLENANAPGRVRNAAARRHPHPVAEVCPVAWLTHLLSAVLASTTPTHAASTTHWTVIVGGASADTSIYANAFFPQAIEIGVGDTVTWIFEGVHNVAFLSGGAAPPFAVPEGDKMYWNHQILFAAGDKTYDGSCSIYSGELSLAGHML